MMQKGACMSTDAACWPGDCQRSLWDLASVPRTLNSETLQDCKCRECKDSTKLVSWNFYNIYRTAMSAVQ